MNKKDERHETDERKGRETMRHGRAPREQEERVL